MSRISLNINNKLLFVSKFGIKLNQYSNYLDTLEVKIEYPFKSSLPAVYLYAERNDKSTNDKYSTQLLYNSTSDCYEYQFGSNDGNSFSSWFTAIPGPLKLSLEIIDGEDLLTTDKYTIWINASITSNNDTITLNANEFNNIINFLQSAFELKLNKDDYVIYNVGTFTHLKDVAHAVLEHKNTQGGSFIYKAKVEDTTMGFSKDALAIVGYDNNHEPGSFRTIIICDDQIVLYGGLDNEEVQLLNIPELIVRNLKVFSSIEVPTPTEDASAVNKKYLMNNFYCKKQTYNKDEITELLNSLHALKFEVVDELPTKDKAKANVIYLKSLSESEKKEEILVPTGEFGVIVWKFIDNPDGVWFTGVNGDNPVEYKYVRSLFVNQNGKEINSNFDIDGVGLNNNGKIFNSRATSSDYGGYFFNIYGGVKSSEESGAELIFKSVSKIDSVEIEYVTSNHIDRATIYNEEHKVIQGEKIDYYTRKYFVNGRKVSIANNSENTYLYIRSIKLTYYEPNVYEEYVFINGAWEIIGTTKIDLKDYLLRREAEIEYAKKAQVPTKISELSNDSGFIDRLVTNLANYYLKSETYTKEEVRELINSISTVSLLKVEQLPTENISPNTIYLVLKQDGVSPNIYEEYVYVNGSWEIIGTTEINLSDYLTIEQGDRKYALNSNTFSFAEVSINSPKSLTIKNVYDSIQSQLPNQNNDVVLLRLTGYMTFTGFAEIRYVGAYLTSLYSFKDNKFVSNYYSADTYIDDILNSLSSNVDVSSDQEISGTKIFNTLKSSSILLNDKEVATKEDVPTKTSQLNNDSNFVPKNTIAKLNGIELTNGGNIVTKDISVNEIKQIFTEGAGEIDISENYTFVNITTPVTVRQRACCYGNGYFVIAGTSGALVYSTDKGKTWANVSPFTSAVITGIAYGNGMFVCVDSEGNIWKTDIPSNNWVLAKEFGTDIIIESVRYINNEFVAVGHFGLITKSNDAIHWQQVHKYNDTATDNYLIDVGYGNGKYVAVGKSGLVLTSTNTVIWYDNTITDYNTNDYDIRAIIYTNGTFVVGTKNGRIDYSEDLNTWTQANHPTDLSISWIRNFAYGDNRLYTCMYSGSSKGYIWYSEDKGRTWEISHEISSMLWCICFGEDTFIASGDKGLAQVLDLELSWSSEVPNSDYYYYKLEVTQNDGSKTYSDIYSINHKYVDLTSDQTIGGTKTFENGFILSNTSASGNATWTIQEDLYGQLTFARTYNNFTETMFEINGSSLNPKTNNKYSLGNADRKWKNLYIGGVLTDGTNSVSVEELSKLSTQGGSGGGGETRPLKEYVEAGITTKELEPNKYYIFDSQVSASLTLTFAQESEEYLDEFMGEIRVDEQDINITFPKDIRWNENQFVAQNENVLTLTSKNRYLFSIANNLGLITNIPNPSLAKPITTLTDGILTWEEVEGTQKYEMYYNNTLKATVNSGETLSLNVKSILDQYSVSGASFNFVLKAVSNYYTDSFVSLTYDKIIKLSTPTNLVLSESTLSWDKVSLADSYEVYVGTVKATTVTNNYIDLSTITGYTGTYDISVKAIYSYDQSHNLPSELSEKVSYTWEATM